MSRFHIIAEAGFIIAGAFAAWSIGADLRRAFHRFF
jgi:hypothetical protein